MSAAAVILVLILAGVYLITRSVPMRDIIADVPVKETLEDGSRLELRTHAHMRVPERFASRARKVEMVSGEAFFDIAADANRPFKIEHQYGIVEVVGTEFIISLDTIAHEFALHVLEGKVTFTPDLSDNVATVLAGEGLIFDADTRILETIQEPNPNAVSWYTKTLSFIDTPVKEVVSQLKHHYELEISLTDEHVGNCLFTSPLPYLNVPVRVILDALCTTYGMQLKEETGKYVLSGGKCR
jgi:ferric-dicitrate binding protein FerR (iron transport regulator)